MNGQGIFSRALTWLFGASWYTSMSGYIAILAYLIHDKPQVIGWIPEPAKGVIWNVSEYIFLGGFLAFAQGVKSRAVTGGTTQQTTTGAAAETTSQSVRDTNKADPKP